MEHRPPGTITTPMTTPDPPPDGDDQPVSTLRGAGVNFDVHRVGQVAIGLVLATLAVLVVAFTLAGVHRNDQINRLHHQGVKVNIKVTGCLGLMGGSGSNVAGYACRGNFTLDGVRYNEAIPGNTFFPPGHLLRAVSVPGDPALLSPLAAATAEHASAKVFLLPGILLAVLALMVGALLLRRRRTHDPPPG